jgi:DNA polymerase I
VRAAKYSNQYLGTHFGKASKPKRLYIKSVPPGYPRTDVVAFEYGDEKDLDKFKIDIETMVEKTLKQPISRILEPIGFNWNDFDPCITTLKKWGLS